jgi:Rrf2 family transcriptional regulator, nitric oxide-sensitive transcriptional repressor
MRLTLWTDYALRTLIYLATKDRDLATIGEIAFSFDISKPHLMKVINRLSQQGYVDAVRGKGGGVRLARPAATISLGEVVRDNEETLAVMGCLEQTGFCRIERCCVLKGALQEATRAFMRVLDGFTLADLVAPKAKLKRALALEPEAHSGV